MTHRVQSIERGIDVLMALVEGPKTLTEIARKTSLSKGTAFRMLSSLGYENTVVKSDTNVYMLGPGCLRLIDGVMNGLGASIGAGRAALEELWRKTGETVTIHVRVGPDRVCIEELPSEHPIRYTSNVGSSAPLHIGSAGRILLAFLAPDDLERALASLSAHGTLDAQKLAADLVHVRERGYDLSEGERVHGAAAISAPIVGRNGFVASLSVLGPDFRFTEDRRLAFVPDLQRAAEATGAALVEIGGSGADEQAAVA